MAKENKLIEWLRIHDLISIHALEKKCGIPQSLLNKAITGYKPLPEKHISALKIELKKYGLK